MTFYKLIAYKYFDHENVTYANSVTYTNVGYDYLVHMLLILVSLNQYPL